MKRQLTFFIKGLLKIILYIVLSPILIPMMLIDIILWMGGEDPFDTPIRKLMDKLNL